ncbi:MAG: hypothetical protein M3457_16145 [Chloroflexota bacterium]|nr:hypothetical protein [Chloroflexota bacterium]
MTIEWYAAFEGPGPAISRHYNAERFKGLSFLVKVEVLDPFGNLCAELLHSAELPCHGRNPLDLFHDTGKTREVLLTFSFARIDFCSRELKQAIDALALSNLSHQRHLLDFNLLDPPLD